MTDLTQRITDVPPESVHDHDCSHVVLDIYGERTDPCDCGVPTLWVESLSRITELEAEVARLRAEVGRPDRLTKMRGAL